MPRNKTTKRQLQRLGNPPCIFCGARATTFDHYPPTCFFKDDIWPDGYKFPACADCNSNSSQQDLLVALLGRLGPPDMDAAEFKRWSGLFESLVKAMPKVAEEMFESKAAIEGREKIVQKYGGALSSVHIPPAAQWAIRVFAAKLTKALHFLHSGQALPDGAAIRFRWFSNQSLFEGDGRVIPDSVAKLLGMSGPIQRERRNLKEQFDYNFAISAEKTAAIYYCFFRNSFAFISFVSADPAVVEGAVEAIKRALPSSTNEDVFERIYWPAKRESSDRPQVFGVAE